jgi:hypothetical protein
MPYISFYITLGLSCSTRELAEPKVLVCMASPGGGGVNAVDSSKARMKKNRNFEQDKLIFV